MKLMFSLASLLLFVHSGYANSIQKYECACNKRVSNGATADCTSNILELGIEQDWKNHVTALIEYNENGRIKSITPSKSQGMFDSRVSFYHKDNNVAASAVFDKSNNTLSVNSKMTNGNTESGTFKCIEK